MVVERNMQSKLPANLNASAWILLYAVHATIAANEHRATPMRILVESPWQRSG